MPFRSSLAMSTSGRSVYQCITGEQFARVFTVDKIHCQALSLSLSFTMHRVCRTLLKLKKVCPPRQSPSSDLNDFKRWVSLGLPRGSRFATGFTPLQFKPLDSIIDTQRVSQYSAEELVKIWDDYHLGRGHVSASMDQKLYHLLDQRAITCQHFVIPLPRGSGYTTIFIQAKMPHILFTGLEDYKARGTQAAPYFTVTYYKEFAETKGMVLVRGDIVFTSKLSDSEARWLLETTHSFYMNDTRYKLVERFNRETRDFEFKDVLSSLGISAG